MPDLVQAEIASAMSTFRWNEAVYEALLHGPHGPVFRNLIARALLVEAAAKQNASQPPRDGPNSGSEPGHGPAVRTGRLRGSITWRPGVDAISPYIDIGTAVFYAPFVELGTSRMDARPFLRPALEHARALG